MKSIRSNSQTTFYINFFWSFLVINSIITPLYLSKGLTFSQIGMINSLFILVKSASDYPLGLLSDQLGAKFTLLIAGLLKGIGGTILVFASDFSHFLLAFTVIGLANGFYSGADLKIFAEEKPLDFTKNIMNKVFYVQMGMAASSIAGSAIAATGKFQWPLIINCLIAWIPLFLTLRLSDPKSHSLNFKKIEMNLVQNARQFFQLVFNSQYLTALFLIRILTFGLFFIQIQFQQSVLVYMKIPIFFFGFIFFAKALITGYLSKHSKLISHYLHISFEKALFIFPLLSLLAVEAYRWVGPWAILITIFLDIANGLTSGKLVANFTRHLDSSKVVSFNSLITTLGAVVGALGVQAVGYSIDHYGFPLTYLWYFCGGVLLNSLLYILWLRAHRSLTGSI